MSNAQLFEFLHELRLADFREELGHQRQLPEYADILIHDRIGDSPILEGRIISI